MANLEGAYLLLIIQQRNNTRNIHKEICKNISDEYLTLIIIPIGKLSQIHWIKDGSEFVHKGKLFDIVRCKILGEYKYFYCINDIKEKQLISAFQKKCEQNKSRKPLRKVNGPVFIFSSFSFPIPIPIYLHDINSYAHDYKSRISEICCPPPKQLILL